jgi:hypothetical protein
MMGSTHVIKFKDLTLTFISNSYLDQHPLKLENCLKIFFSRTASARSEEKPVS